MIPAAISEKIKIILSKYCGREVNTTRDSPVGGGCINHAMKVEASSGNFFLKWNDAKRYPGMFEAEAKGLTLLKSVNAIRIPEVIGTSEVDGNSFIVLEFIESGRREKNFWQDFGASLARLHKHTSDFFGLEHDNYIGSLPPEQLSEKNMGRIFYF
ncbi:MAG: fructosamine kinase family protein [Bacteroidia bacterium]|nr:fructosamine kinase family protein [Bacteroidia bacterium]